MENFKTAEVLYENNFANEASLDDFRLEGSARVSAGGGALKLANALDPSLGQKANFVLWNKNDFPDKISIEWDFTPVEYPGLAMTFFSAKGTNGEDIFDPSLPERTGRYEMYYNGGINAYHISYFRRNDAESMGFNTCNLRKSKGFYLVCQGADPIPSLIDAACPYRIKIIKYGAHILFYINGLKIFHYADDGATYGKIHCDGKIGLRQMAPLVAEYRNFRVCSVIPGEGVE